jgi:hypothetical protein
MNPTLAEGLHSTLEFAADSVVSQAHTFDPDKDKKIAKFNAFYHKIQASSVQVVEYEQQQSGAS